MHSHVNVGGRRNEGGVFLKFVHEIGFNSSGFVLVLIEDKVGSIDFDSLQEMVAT